MTLTSEVLTAIVGVNSVLGLLGLLAYLFTYLKLQTTNRLERISIREAIEGQQIFTAEQVIGILREFQTDDARIRALRELAKVQNKSQESADRVYGKVKGAIDVIKNQKIQLTKIAQAARGVTPIFLVVAAMAFSYGVVTNSDFIPLLSGYFISEKPYTLAFHDIAGLDGEGNHVSNVSDIQVRIVPDRGRRSADILVSYGFYNGSGTWRGSQNLIITLLGPNKTVLGRVVAPLDRGKCVYGAPEPRSYSVMLRDVAQHITSIDAVVTRVSGVQTRC